MLTLPIEHRLSNLAQWFKSQFKKIWMEGLEVLSVLIL